MVQSKLMLHCGAREVSREQLDAIPCPPAEGRWRPVPHGTVLTYATRALEDAGYEVEKLSLGVSRNDARFFGTITLGTPLVVGTSLAVGIRSSLDKSIALGWCCGHRVFVCDNMAFSSEKVISRKHTTNGVTRYQEAICRAVTELAEYREVEAKRIQALQYTDLSDAQAESVLFRAYHDAKLLSPRTIPTAVKEWRDPSFPGFEEKTAWRLFNAITFALGNRAKTNPQAHAAATIRLGGLMQFDVPAHGTVPAALSA